MKKKLLPSHFILAILLLLLLSGSTVFAKTPQKDGKKTIEEKTLAPLDILKKGNERFMSDKSTHPRQDLARVLSLAKAQNPNCIIVSCSDSRVSPEIIFDQGLGDIFSIRTAGNVMSDYEEGSIEYAVEHLHTPLIVVMGHQGCGAIQALLDHIDDDDEKDDDDDEKDDEKDDDDDSHNHKGRVADHISAIIKKLKSEEEEQELLKTVGKNSNLAVLANVMNGVKQLRTSDPILKNSYKKGEINIVGAVYHIDSGKVEFLDY
ncbi:MAG: hypothetical protein RL662_2200 [Bacteroidota bacterium]